MQTHVWTLLPTILLSSCTSGPADEELTVAELSERGRHLFFLADSCVDCHGEDGSGGARGAGA